MPAHCSVPFRSAVMFRFQSKMPTSDPNTVHFQIRPSLTATHLASKPRRFVNWTAIIFHALCASITNTACPGGPWWDGNLQVGMLSPGQSQRRAEDLGVKPWILVLPLAPSPCRQKKTSRHGGALRPRQLRLWQSWRKLSATPRPFALSFRRQSGKSESGWS